MDCIQGKPTSTESHSGAAHAVHQPVFGIAGVFLGAALATLNARLVGVASQIFEARKNRVRRSVMDPNRAEHGYDVQRSLRCICERSARPRRILPSGGRHFYARFGDVAVVPGYWPMLC